jgi:hypothetical protein
MEKTAGYSIVSRRRLLALGAAGAAMLATPGWMAAWADTIADAEKTPSGPVVKQA